MMDVFFALDKRERLPLRLTVHLLFCKECRTAVRLCTLAEKAAARPLFQDGEIADVAAIMEKVRAVYPIVGNDHPFISLRRWIVLGVVMILAMIFVSFLTLGGSAPGSNALALQFSSYIVFGGMIAVYCAFFVGSNMDFFVKQAHLKKLV
jgi:hypothetical protein